MIALVTFISRPEFPPDHRTRADDRFPRAEVWTRRHCPRRTRQLRSNQQSPALAKKPILKANDGFAAEAAVAKLFEQLARAVQFNHGADARSDRAVREHVRDLVQPLRR